MENEAQLINKYQAEFENACDDLYYGYGYKFWRANNNSIEDDNIAKMVWKAAFNKMSANESKTKNMKKNTVKINEGQLKKIVAESVKKILKESEFNKTKTQELAEVIGKKIDDITNLIQLDFHNTLLSDYGKDSDEYIKGMEIRNKMIELASELKSELWSYFQHYDTHYEQIGY